MIIVSGAKRTGTSLMMQILREAGFDVLGEQFPKAWNKRIFCKNRAGFYESKFVDQGINEANCPFDPKASSLYAVKVFADSLKYTDPVYATKVIVMIRDWREQEESLKRILAVEESKNENPPGYNFFATYREFFKDYKRLNFPAIVIDYHSLLKDPEMNLGNLRRFIGAGRFDIAAKKIKKRFQTVKRRKMKEIESSPFYQFLDLYYNAIKAGFISEALDAEAEHWEKIVYPEIEQNKLKTDPPADPPEPVEAVQDPQAQGKE